MTHKIRAAVVDDEPIARRRLLRLLADEPDVELVGEGADADEARSLLRRQQVDMLFLDVQMPGGSGFTILEEALEPRPYVIFVSAFHEHAARAFEVEATDYVVKPFARERIAHAVARVRRQLEGGAQAAEEVGERRVRLERIQAGESYRSRILVRSTGRVSFVPVDQIRWIEADGNYVRLHCASARHLARETLSQLARELDPTRFARIHRSAIVALGRVRELRRALSGDHTLILDSEERLTLSRTYRRSFERAIEGRAGGLPRGAPSLGPGDQPGSP